MGRWVVENYDAVIRYKRLNKEGIEPKYARAGDSGLDLYSVDELIMKPHSWSLISTGIAIELPKGYEAQVRSRSGLALKHGIFTLNSPGTIDEGYRDELKVILANFSDYDYKVSVGDRIAQLVLAKRYDCQMLEVSELSETERGTGGFGSTGT